MKKFCLLALTLVFVSQALPAHAQICLGCADGVGLWQQQMLWNLNRWGYADRVYGGYGYAAPVATAPPPCGYMVVELPREKTSTKVLAALTSAAIGSGFGYLATGTGQGAARGAAGGGAVYGSIELAKHYLRPGQAVVPAPCPPGVVRTTSTPVVPALPLESKLLQNRFKVAAVRVYLEGQMDQPVAEIPAGAEVVVKVPHGTRLVAFAQVEDGNGREVWTDKIGTRGLTANSGFVYYNPQKGEF